MLSRLRAGVALLVRGDQALPSAADRGILSFVSHDLRSGLTSIKAASTLMLDYEGELDESAKRDMLETIREGADGLDRLMSNAVQLSRSREGKLRPRKVPAALDEVASRTLERLRHTLRDHRVVLVIPEDLPDAPMDVVLLEQAIGNLLENAASLSPPGTEIVLGLRRKGASVVVRVEDVGPAIPPGERERILEPFAELSAGGGAGLRLPISRAIAEAHGGRLTIEDTSGGGTSVLLELPLESGVPISNLGPEDTS